MTSLPIIILIGLMGGIAIGLQAPLGAMISQRLGVLEGVFIIHLGGLIAVGIPLALLGGGKLSAFSTVPWYALAGGVLGVAVIGSTIFMVPKIGVAGAITLIISGQLMIAAAIDHFGSLGVTARTLDLERAIGLAVVLFGAWLTLRRG